MTIALNNKYIPKLSCHLMEFPVSERKTKSIQLPGSIFYFNYICAIVLKKGHEFAVSTSGEIVLVLEYFHSKHSLWRELVEVAGLLHHSLD